MVLARWVLRMLTNDQKRTQLDIPRYLLSQYEDDPDDFIKQEITRKSQERGEKKIDLPLCASVYMCLVVTWWERADLLALVCGVYCVFVTFPIGILVQVWYLIVSIPDLCTLTSFAVLCSRRTTPLPTRHKLR